MRIIYCIIINTCFYCFMFANNINNQSLNAIKDNYNNIVNEKKERQFNKPKDLKIGLILHSNLVYPEEVNKIIQFIISKNIFDGYRNTNGEFIGNYAFISEFSKDNFIKFTKNTNNFLNSLSIKSNKNQDSINKNDKIIKDNIFKNILQYYIEDLKDALYQDNIKYLMSIRGGYSASDLIDDLFALEKPEKEKLFIGFSDSTILHLFFSQEWGWKTLHGPVLLSANKTSQQNFRKLTNLLLSKDKAILKIDLKPINQEAKAIKNLEGLVTGGNLCVIQTSIGTKIQINTKDKILILEETKESILKVKRMLKHLKDAKLLDNVKAIIVGTIDCGEEIKMPTILQVFFDKLSVPVFYTNKIGHNKYNFPFIINEKAKIINNNNKFIFYQMFQNIYN